MVTQYPSYRRAPEPVETHLGGIPIIQILSGVLSIAVSGGWFAKAEWDDDILGRWPGGNHGEPQGGILDELEGKTGRRYPDLHQMRIEARKAYTAYRHAAPWHKAKTAEEYQESVRKFSRAVQRKIEDYQREVSPAGVLGRTGTALGQAITSPDWWRKYSPYFLILGLGITSIIVLARRK